MGEKIYNLSIMIERNAWASRDKYSHHLSDMAGT